MPAHLHLLLRGSRYAANSHYEDVKRSCNLQSSPLSSHNFFEYGDDGKVHGLAFTIKVNDRFIPIKLPARVEKAQVILKKQWEEGVISHKRGKENTYGYEQAYRVAWRNILDWVLAQMALLEIGMAKIDRKSTRLNSS